MASRRRRRKSIGKVITDVERRVRRVEKRPGATRLKRNVVTGEKIQYRTIASKAIEANAVTATEAAFGIPVVSDTEPSTNLKAGTIWVDPTDGAAAVYDYENRTFVPITDTNAQASADGKNTIYRQASQPTGGTYVTGDIWFDTDDDNKIYRYQANTTSWVGFTLGNNALASISATKITAGSLDANVIVTSNLDAGQITTGVLRAITIQQGSSGNYILMDQTNTATIKFNVTGFTNPGFISVESMYSGTLGWLSLQAPTTGSETDVASIDLAPESMYLSAGYIDIESTGNFSLGNSSGGIQIKYDITTTPTGDAPNPGLNRFIKSIRNIWQSPNSYTPGGSDGAEGDVWLTY